MMKNAGEENIAGKIVFNYGLVIAEALGKIFFDGFLMLGMCQSMIAKLVIFTLI